MNNNTSNYSFNKIKMVDIKNKKSVKNYIKSWFGDLYIKYPNLEYIVEAISSIYSDLHKAVDDLKYVHSIIDAETEMLDHIEKMYGIEHIKELPNHTRLYFIINKLFFIHNKGSLECFNGLTYILLHGIFSITPLWSEDYQNFVTNGYTGLKVDDGGTWWQTPHCRVNIETTDVPLVADEEGKYITLCQKNDGNPKVLISPVVLDKYTIFYEYNYPNKKDEEYDIYLFNSESERVYFTISDFSSRGNIKIIGKNEKKENFSENLVILSNGDIYTTNKFSSIVQIIATGNFKFTVKQSKYGGLVWSLDEVIAMYSIYKPADMVIDGISNQKTYIDIYNDVITDSAIWRYQTYKMYDYANNIVDIVTEDIDRTIGLDGFVDYIEPYLKEYFRKYVTTDKPFSGSVGVYSRPVNNIEYDYIYSRADERYKFYVADLKGNVKYNPHKKIINHRNAIWSKDKVRDRDKRMKYVSKYGVVSDETFYKEGKHNLDNDLYNKNIKNDIINNISTPIKNDSIIKNIYTIKDKDNPYNIKQEVIQDYKIHQAKVQRSGKQNIILMEDNYTECNENDKQLNLYLDLMDKENKKEELFNYTLNPINKDFKLSYDNTDGFIGDNTEINYNDKKTITKASNVVTSEIFLKQIVDDNNKKYAINREIIKIYS